MCGCKVMLGVNGEIQMITFVGKDGCNSSSGTWSIVVSELEFGPNVLLVVAIDLVVLFQSLVWAFSLAITFRVISGSEISSAVPREWKKWDTNLVPQSEVTWLRTPCLERTWRTKSCTSCRDVMVL